MRRLRTVAGIVREVVTSPSSLGLIVDAKAESRHRRHVAESFGLGQGLPTIDLLDLVPDFDETVFPYSFLDGQATPPDIGLLRALARRVPDSRFLEIGTWRGESLANVAAVAGNCVSISLSADEMRELGLPPHFVDAHGFYTQDLDNVVQIAANSQTFDYSTLGEGFDVVFVDGDHSRAGVAVDSSNVFPVLRDDRSVIVWHDYGRSPESVRWEVLAGILDGSPPSARPHLYHVSNTLCAIYIRGSFQTRYTSGFGTPDKVFSLRLQAQRPNGANQSVLERPR